MQILLHISYVSRTCGGWRWNPSRPGESGCYSESRTTKIYWRCAKISRNGKPTEQICPDASVQTVVYISKSLSTAEARYAQIEKESLAFTWACERLANWAEIPHWNWPQTTGASVQYEKSGRTANTSTEVSHEDDEIWIYYRARTWLKTDTCTLSLSISRTLTSRTVTSRRSYSAFVNTVIENLPASDQRLEEIKRLQKENSVKPYYPIAMAAELSDWWCEGAELWYLLHCAKSS